MSGDEDLTKRSEQRIRKEWNTGRTLDLEARIRLWILVMMNIKVETRKHKPCWRNRTPNRKETTKQYDLFESGEESDTDKVFIQPHNDLYTKGVDNRSYRLGNRNSKYTNEVAHRIT